jgi:hypothetical protein
MWEIAIFFAALFYLAMSSIAEDQYRELEAHVPPAPKVDAWKSGCKGHVHGCDCDKCWAFRFDKVKQFMPDHWKAADYRTARLRQLAHDASKAVGR